MFEESRPQSIFSQTSFQDNKTKLFQEKDSPWHKSPEKVKSQFVAASISKDIAEISDIANPCKVNQTIEPNICLRNLCGEKCK